jgi:hypothetical protein
MPRYKNIVSIWFLMVFYIIGLLERFNVEGFSLHPCGESSFEKQDLVRS